MSLILQDFITLAWRSYLICSILMNCAESKSSNIMSSSLTIISLRMLDGLSKLSLYCFIKLASIARYSLVSCFEYLIISSILFNYFGRDFWLWFLLMTGRASLVWFERAELKEKLFFDLVFYFGEWFIGRRRLFVRLDFRVFFIGPVIGVSVMSTLWGYRGKLTLDFNSICCI